MTPVPDRCYHEETITHLGLEVTGLSESALALLDARERTCGIRLPAAVREWYALEAGLAQRNLYFGASLIPLERLGEPYPSWSPDGQVYPLDLIGEGRLPVMIGEYGEHLWTVELDGSENPPVSVAEDECAKSVAEIAWQAHAGSFSDFILGMCWVNAWIYRTGFHGLFLNQFPGDQRFFTGDFGPLSARFTEGPRTVNHPCGFMTTRFTGHGVALAIDDLPEAGASDTRGEPHRPCDLGIFTRAPEPVRLRRWSIKAASDDALVQFASDLRQRGLLNRLSMYTAFHKPELEAILEPICVRRV